MKASVKYTTSLRSTLPLQARVNVPASSFKRSPAAPPLGSFVPGFQPIHPASIPIVNPLSVAATHPPINRSTQPPRVQPLKPRKIGPKIAGAAAGAATLLVTATAAASPGLIPQAVGALTALANQLPFGPVLGTLGLTIFTISGARIMWNKYQALKNENLQSPKSKVSLNSPTPRKILKTLVLPFWALTVGVGSIMDMSGAVEAAAGWSTGSVAGYGFAALAAVTLFQGLVAAGRNLYSAYQHKYKFRQKNLVYSKFVPMAVTNLLGRTAWLALIGLQVKLSEVYGTQFLGTVMSLPHNIYATFTGGSIAPVVAGFAAGGALIGGAYHLFLGRRTTAQGNPLKNLGSLAWSTAKAALKGAATGVVLCWAGVGHVATNVFCFALATVFGHNFIHSLRSQEGGITQAEKKRPVHDLQTLHEGDGPRGAKSDVVTMIRPGIGMVDTLVAGYASLAMREGAHDVLNAATGCFVAGDYKQAQEMITNLLDRDFGKMRALLKEGYDGVQSATTVAGAYEAAAAALEKTAQLLNDDKLEHTDVNEGHPIAWGDLKARSGLPYLKDGVFRAGLPGAEHQRSDQDMRVQGLHLRHTARILEARVEKLRAEGRTYAAELDADLDSVKASLGKRLNAAYCRAYPPCDTHAGRFWTNFLPDSYNAKQFLVDVVMQVMSDFVGGMEVAVLNPRGKIEIWMVPMRVVKDFKEDYKTVRTIESRDQAGEDLRIVWYDRMATEGEEGKEEHGGHNIGDSLCEIAYIDNYAYYRKYEKDLKRFPTAEVLTVPNLESKPLDCPLIPNLQERQEFYDVVYKNGTHLRIFANGEQAIVVYDELSETWHRHEVRSQADIKRWLPENAAAVLMVPETRREEYVAQAMRDETTSASVLYGIQTSDYTLGELAKGNVPHPFGAGKATSLSADPLLRPRRHFMYPTVYFSISDADQVDLEVSNLGLHHTQANPHLRLMRKPVRQEKLPFSADMVERQGDSFQEVGVALTWMLSKAKLTDGRELYFPLNYNKENENTFAGDFWKYIDHEEPAQVHVAKDGQQYLRLALRPQTKKDPAYHAVKAKMNKSPMDISIVEENGLPLVQVPMPLEMRDVADQLAEVKVDPVRYGEVGGPVPVIDYVFARRTGNGLVTDRARARTLSVHTADMLLAGITNLMSQAEIEHMELVGDANPRHRYAWTDTSGMVHMSISVEEYDQLKPWLPQYYGQQPVYKDGELLVQVKHFEELCRDAYDEFTYRRFMPSDTYPNSWEAAETS